MKIYEVSGLRESWNIVRLLIKAKDEKAARAKFRKRVNGRCSNVQARERYMAGEAQQEVKQ